jgi:cyclohexa-1,5-dienecarbonyl-CoA hydratase
MAEGRVSTIDDGAYWRVTFGNGEGNILDHDTMKSIAAVFRKAKASAGLKAICLEGAGRHFSYGASVQEHLPGRVGQMLATFRELAFAILDANVVVIAGVRGKCLGGGLEVATLCHRIVAAPSATFAQPEIALGVFAPVGSIVLVERVGRAHAEDLCLTGRTLDATEAQRIGLIDTIDDDPAVSALAWAKTHFDTRSASSLRHAVRAVRHRLVLAMETQLPVLETRYLNELMKTPDATEGLLAFIEKRPPVWS